MSKILQLSFLALLLLTVSACSGCGGEVAYKAPDPPTSDPPELEAGEVRENPDGSVEWNSPSGLVVIPPPDPDPSPGGPREDLDAEEDPPGDLDGFPEPGDLPPP